MPRGKRVRGAHIYATVAGSGQIDALETTDAAAETVRILGAWIGEVSKIAAAFEIPVIAAQGARVHLLNFRPIDADVQLAWKAILFAVAVRRMTLRSLNTQLEAAAALRCRLGIDLGETVGTRGGTGGDSELLFLGSAANRAAKQLSARGIVISDRLNDLLGDEREVTVETINDTSTWALSMTAEDHDDAVQSLGVDWSIQKSTERVQDDLDTWPTERCKVGSAQEQISFDALGRSKSKLVEAAVVIADVDGYSAYIEGLEDDDQKRDAIIALDMVRYELREVLKNDYSGGVRVQYQGDNIIGLIHMPGKPTVKVAERALDVAAGWQASMQQTLNTIVPEAKGLTVTVGVALADTLATQLGPRGRRNALIVGPAVTKADRITEALDGNEVGFSVDAFNALPVHLRDPFKWSASAHAYVADEMTADKLSLMKEAEQRGTDPARARLYPADGEGRRRVGAAAGVTPVGAADVRVFKPYAE